MRWHTSRWWSELLPLLCPLCEQASLGGDVCEVCLDLLRGARQPQLARCGRCDIALPTRLLNSQSADSLIVLQCTQCTLTEPAFDRVVSAFDFSLPGDLLIHRIKAEKRLSLIPAMGRLLAETYHQRDFSWSGPMVLVPVPAQAQSIKVRGFNPATELAKSLAKLLALENQPTWLSRRRVQPRRQAALGRGQRLLAASQAYAVRYCPPGTHIAIVDDVMTTGSTLHYISRLFKRAGAASVTGLVLARTPATQTPP